MPIFVDENGLGISQDEFWFNYISCYDGYVIHLNTSLGRKSQVLHVAQSGNVLIFLLLSRISALEVVFGG